MSRTSFHVFDLTIAHYCGATEIVKGHVTSCQSGVPPRRTEPNVRLTVCGSEERLRRMTRVTHGHASLVMTAAATGCVPRLSSCWLRVDSHQERLLAVLDLQNDCGFDWVPIFVKLVGACHAREGRILHGIPDVRALDRAGSLECVEEQSCSVIRKSTH